MNASRQHTDQHDDRVEQVAQSWHHPRPCDPSMSLPAIVALLIVGALCGSFWTLILQRIWG